MFANSDFMTDGVRFCESKVCTAMNRRGHITRTCSKSWFKAKSLIKTLPRIFIFLLLIDSKSVPLTTSGSFTKTFGCQPEFKLHYYDQWSERGWPNARSRFWSHHCEAQSMANHYENKGLVVRKSDERPAFKGETKYFIAKYAAVAHDRSYVELG